MLIVGLFIFIFFCRERGTRLLDYSRFETLVFSWTMKLTREKFNLDSIFSHVLEMYINLK